jgi:hypothetical protein
LEWTHFDDGAGRHDCDFIRCVAVISDPLRARHSYHQTVKDHGGAYPQCRHQESQTSATFAKKNKPADTRVPTND